MHGNRIMRLIERRLFAPAYVVMLAGLLVRSVALVLTVALPYGSWPLLVRVLVELFAALGMVACADIVLAASAARTSALDRQIDAVQNADEYQPNLRLSGERFQRQKTLLDQKRERAVAALCGERKKEWVSVLFCGGITVSYGILFAATILHGANIVAVVIEVVGISAIPFITWYAAAQYKEQTVAPEEHAQNIALESVDQRLENAKERMRAGEQSDEDLNLLEVATGESAYHKRLVQALRRPNTEIAYLATPEIYRLFGVTDSSGQSTIRRIVRRCGEKKLHGVVWDAQADAWRTPKASLIEMFPQFIGPMRETPTPRDTQRTPASQERAPADVGAAPVLALAGPTADSSRALIEGSDAYRASKV